MNLHEVVLVAAACGCHLLVKLAAQPETLCIFMAKMLPEMLRKREKEVYLTNQLGFYRM